MRRSSGFTLIETFLVVMMLLVIGGGVIFLFSLLFSQCAGGGGEVTSKTVYRGVFIHKARTLYSSGEGGDRFYRVWSRHSGVFDFRDGYSLGWRSGEMWGQIEEGKICDFRVKTGYFICGKYKCVTQVLRCRWPAKPKPKFTPPPLPRPVRRPIPRPQSL